MLLVPELFRNDCLPSKRRAARPSQRRAARPLRCSRRGLLAYCVKEAAVCEPDGLRALVRLRRLEVL